MKFLLAAFLLLTGLTACSAPSPEPNASSEGVANAVGSELQRAPFGAQAPPLADPIEIAAIDQLSRDWIAAFEAGDPKPVRFMFAREAIFLTAEHEAMLADTASSADALFENYTTRLALTDAVNQDEEQNWASYKALFELSLTPKSGGESIALNGNFFVRFHREPDGSFEVMHGPVEGDAAPDFTLNYMKGDGSSVQLSGLQDKPTVLVFGSYT